MKKWENFLNMAVEEKASGGKLLDWMTDLLDKERKPEKALMLSGDANEWKVWFIKLLQFMVGLENIIYFKAFIKVHSDLNSEMVNKRLIILPDTSQLDLALFNGGIIKSLLGGDDYFFLDKNNEAKRFTPCWSILCTQREPFKDSGSGLDSRFLNIMLSKGKPSSPWQLSELMEEAAIISESINNGG